MAINVIGLSDTTTTATTGAIGTTKNQKYKASDILMMLVLVLVLVIVIVHI